MIWKDHKSGLTNTGFLKRYADDNAHTRAIFAALRELCKQHPLPRGQRRRHRARAIAFYAVRRRNWYMAVEAAAYGGVPRDLLRTVIMLATG